MLTVLDLGADQRRPRKGASSWCPFWEELKLTVHQRQEALERRARGEALVDIARSFNVSHSTISRLGAAFTA
jgi:IS30 family transposase